MLISLVLLASSPGRALVYQAPSQAPSDWNLRRLMRLTVFQSGESDCMLLEAGGECMMIDGGADPWRKKLKEALDKRNIHHFKYLFNTHPHDDHISGLYRLMQYGFTADALAGMFPENFPYKLHQRALKQAKKSGIPYRQCANGDTLTLGEATLSLYRWEKGKTINDLSAMVRVTFGNTSLLLCGDMTGAAQKHLLSTMEKDELRADIVKAPHHGITPFVKEFLDAVNPDVLFVTNKKSRAAKLDAQAGFRKLPVYYAANGAIVIETDGTDWYIRQED